MLIREIIDRAVAAALAEDIGSGDITTEAVIPPERNGHAVILAKAPGVICGIDVAQAAFRLVDSRTQYQPRVIDGMRVDGDREELADIDGPAASILTAERVALNFLQRMSGIATITAAYVDAVSGSGARIIDTRKTTPGLRAFEKYAVRCGGGSNHRFGLSDGVLIKDNHIEAAGGIAAAIERARSRAPHLMKIEIEVKAVEQIPEALDAGADVIMLDNMDVATMRAAVEMIAGRVLVEASGGVSLASVRAIAETGVDLISVGALTHSARSLDISLELELVEPVAPE